MEITIESITKKIGFDPLDVNSYNEYYNSRRTNKSSWAVDDSIPSPFSVLTLEESLFLNDYLMKHKNLTN